MIREDILKPYEMHLKLTGRHREDPPAEMTLEELKHRIRALKEGEILTVDAGGGS